MRDLSMHILDLCENGVRAGANLIDVEVEESKDIVRIIIKDNGCGMSEEQIKKALDPFYTTKKDRKKKVGLGLPLMKQRAEMCGGSFYIESYKGKGTKIECSMNPNNVDIPPMGDLSETFWTLIVFYPECDFLIKHIKNGKKITIDSREIKSVLEGIPLNHPEVAPLIKKMIKEEEEKLNQYKEAQYEDRRS